MHKREEVSAWHVVLAVPDIAFDCAGV